MYIVAFFMQYINYNGAFYEKDAPVLMIQNRSFRYGDGLFETIRVQGKKAFLPEMHFDRLIKSLQVLQYNIPAYLDVAWFHDALQSIIEKNQLSQGSLRFSVWSGDHDLFFPEREFNFSIETKPLVAHFFNFNDKGLDIGLYNQAVKAPGIFANVKTASCLLYAMAAKLAANEHLDDVLILNTNECIIETTIANIFLIKGNTIITPPLQDGCVAGVYRAYVMQKLEKDYNIHERSILLKDIEEADEIFLTNAIRGIRWVESFQNHKYKNKITRQLADKITSMHS